MHKSSYGSPDTAGSYKSVRVVPLSNESQPKLQTPSTKFDPMKQDAIQPKLRVVSDPSQFPIGTRMSDNIPVREMVNSPSNFKEYRKVDSKSGSKSIPGEVPKFIGSSFTHTVNAPTRQVISPPVDVTVPRPYPVLTPSSYSSGPPLNNRTMTGRILGTPQKNFVPAQNVPYLPSEQPVGPDNPVKALSDVWSACWDKEAGAIYYYNQVSGEATWIPPEL